MQQFIDRTGVGVFPNVNDENGDIWRRYGVSYQPAFVFLNDDGTATTFGSLNEETLQENIDTLL